MHYLGALSCQRCPIIDSIVIGLSAVDAPWCFCLFWASCACYVSLCCSTTDLSVWDELRMLWPFQMFSNACFLLTQSNAAILWTSAKNNDCFCFKQRTQQHWGISPISVLFELQKSSKMVYSSIGSTLWVVVVYRRRPGPLLPLYFEISLKNSENTWKWPLADFKWYIFSFSSPFGSRTYRITAALCSPCISLDNENT